MLPFFLAEDMPGESLIFVAIFPVTGILMLYFSVRKRNLYLKIIKTGKFTYGTYKSSHRTNVTINNSPVYRYFFEFKDESGTIRQATGDTHTGRLSDEPKELLVYNPDNPDEALMIDALPYKVKSYILEIIEEEKDTNVISTF
jgi:hypothetical protein